MKIHGWEPIIPQLAAYFVDIWPHSPWTSGRMAAMAELLGGGQ